MSDVTQILQAIERGNGLAAEQLLPLVYQELRQLAAAKLAQEKPGQTLQPTALVHEAYLRLVDVTATPNWDNRGHFFAAAAEAMRRILIETARRKRLVPRVNLEVEVSTPPDDERWFLLADALTALAESDASAAQVAQLRLLGGLSVEEAGRHLGISRATAYREWDFARAWLADRLGDHPDKKSN